MKKVLAIDNQSVPIEKIPFSYFFWRLHTKSLLVFTKKLSLIVGLLILPLDQISVFDFETLS